MVPVCLKKNESVCLKAFSNFTIFQHIPACSQDLQCLSCPFIQGSFIVSQCSTLPVSPANLYLKSNLKSWHQCEASLVSCGFNKVFKLMLNYITIFIWLLRIWVDTTVDHSHKIWLSKRPRQAPTPGWRWQPQHLFPPSQRQSSEGILITRSLHEFAK